jgi:hypothetical protein
MGRVGDRCALRRSKGLSCRDAGSPNVKRLATFLLGVALVGLAGGHGAGVATAANAEPTVAPSGLGAGLDDAAALAEAEALWASDPATRDALVAEIGAELELAVAEQSGLAEALGGRDAAADALARAWAPLISTVRDTLGPELPPVAIASLVAIASDGPTIGEGMFGGFMTVALGAEGVVGESNDLAGGKPTSGHPDGLPELSLDLAPERANMAMEWTHESDGLKTTLKTKVAIAPCPSADGTFVASATIDVSATKGSVGQNGTLDLKVTGHVDDDAKLTSSDLEYRMQWAKFGGPRGQYVDVGGTLGGATLRRSGGAATPELASEAAATGLMYAMLTKHFLEEAAQKGWESGRCVRLDATPSAGPKDLEPGQVVSLLTAPRSKIDGAAVGGSVTAVLTAGGATVAPSATKVPADATFTYAAPDQIGKSGTVSLEARSKRGVAKVSVDLTTAAAHTVTITGPLKYSFNGFSGTATIDLTMSRSPDGTFAGTAQVRMTGSMKMTQTRCKRAKWTETIDLTGELTGEMGDQVLAISTTGVAPQGRSRPMPCTTAGVTVRSVTPHLSSSLFGGAHVRLVDGDQAFTVTAAPGKVSGTVNVKLS